MLGLERELHMKPSLLRLRSLGYICLFCLGSEGAARADMGVPMIFVTMPLMVIALIPIILIESFILARKIHASVKSVLWATSAANVVSTFIGIPITWALLLLVEMLTGSMYGINFHTALGHFLSVTIQSPWMIPWESDLYWMVPAASLFLLIPFFFASYVVECAVTNKMIKKVSRHDVRKGVFIANIASYALLAIYVLGWLLVSLQFHRTVPIMTGLTCLKIVRESNGTYKPTLIWNYRPGGGFKARPAITATGKIYACSQYGYIYALNSATGILIWSYTTGDAVESSPLITANGMVYVGSNDNNVYALDGASGKLKWLYKTGSIVRSSPVIGPNGVLYVGSDDNNVYALNGVTGRKIWIYHTRGSVLSSPALGKNGMVYIGSDDGGVYALNGATGVMRWSYKTGGLICSSPAIGSNGTVYVGSFDDKIYALNGATGEKLWTYKTGDSITSSPAIGQDGTVYIGSDDGKVYALFGNTGMKRWSYDTKSDIETTPAIGSDDMIYVSSDYGKVYAFHGTNGKLIWSYATEGSIKLSSITIGPQKTIYVGTYR